MTTPLQNQLRRAVAEDLVYERQFDSLYLYVYTQTAVTKRIWNDTTRMARGLILDESGQIVARPLDKFFNLFERPETEPKNLPKGQPVIEEKLDGSMGTIFFYEGGWNIATKGSLSSSQAEYARKFLLPLYDFSDMDVNWTLITEIIYPDNRIVVDYGDSSELRLLAVRHKFTGEEIPVGRLPILAAKLGMSVRKVYDIEKLLSESTSTTLFELMSTSIPFEKNSEGYVLRWECGTRVKIKNPWYLRIHKALDMRSQKKILDMVEGGEYRSVLLSLPKELQVQFDDIYSQLRSMMWVVEQEIQTAWDSVAHLKDGARREFAIAVNKDVPSEFRPALFSMLDGHDIRHHVFKVVRSRLKDE